MRRYFHQPDSFKRKVVREVLSGELSKSEANRKYGIRGSSSIQRWIVKFAEQDRPRVSILDYRKKSKEDLIKRIKELEFQLEDEQIRSDGYSKMIDIAEDELNIPIRKKSDAKQSKR